MEIEILNYEKFNPRGDSKKPSWFRFENNFFFSQSMFDLSNDARLVWIFIICYASQKNAGSIQIDSAYISHHAKVSEKQVEEAVKKLEEKQCLKVIRATLARDSHGSRTKSHATNVTNERDERDETNETNYSSAELQKNRSSRGAISPFDSNDVIGELLKNVTHQLQKGWVETYPDPDWIMTELKRANVWILANPKRAPKDFGRFMSSWLSKGFESYRKGLPTRAMTNSEKNMHSLGDMYEKVQRGEL